MRGKPFHDRGLCDVSPHALEMAGAFDGSVAALALLLIGSLPPVAPREGRP
jgi:hypothetical protein